MKERDILVVSTEDGRILFFDCKVPVDEPDSQDVTFTPCIAQLGGRTAGISGRIKDFEILQLTGSAVGDAEVLLIVAGSSDGAIRLCSLHPSELEAADAEAGDIVNGSKHPIVPQTRQVGSVIGMLETGNRITCLGAFIMDESGDVEITNDGDDAALGTEADGNESESDDDDSE